MKTAFALTLLAAATLFAADTKPGKDPETPPSQGDELRRVKSITWDLNAHKLVWVVQKGSMVNGSFVMGTEQQYAIAPDDAAMVFSGEQRGFDGDEAASLQHLLDVLSLYCAESVVWWEQGQGAPMPGNGAGKPKTKTDEEPAAGPKPVRVDDRQPDNKPKYKVPESDYVATAKQ